MSKEEILAKAVEKAVRNLFNNGHSLGFFADEALTGRIHKEGEIIGERFPFYYQIIFSHSFAKAFWGEEKLSPVELYRASVHKEWQYHLQQMVLAKEPLKYIEKFLSNEDSFQNYVI